MKVVEKPREEITDVKKEYKTTVEFSKDNTRTKVYVNTRYVGTVIDISSNCKFSVIDYISYAYSYNEQDTKANIDALLKRSKLAALIQTTQLNIVKFLQDNYDVYSLVRLPIGYGLGYQYHITIRNKLTPHGNFNYARSSKKVDIKDIDSLDREIMQVFKDKRRKVDIVPEIINIIKSKT